MIIVIVNWKIKHSDDHREAFLTKWRTGLPVNDRAGLVGEFLSKPDEPRKYEWITWDLRGGDGYQAFLNVGLWADAEAFHEQIGQYFRPGKEPEAFEYEMRTRALLTPTACRMGDLPLPIHDSGGVL